MTFETEILKNSSKKTMLIRLNPMMKINVVSAGSNLYTTTLTYNVNKVKIAKDYLTLDTSGTPSTGEYYFNETTKLLTVYSSVAITSAYVFRFVFLSTTDDVYAPEIPDDDSKQKVKWNGIVKNSPSFGQNLSNILSGIISTTQSSIDIINEGEYDWFFNKDVHLCNKDFEVWISLGVFFGSETKLSNVKKIFKGRMSDIRKNYFVTTIAVTDPLRALDTIFYPCGEDFSFIKETTGANVIDSAVGLPIPFIYGPRSRLFEDLFFGATGVWEYSTIEKFPSAKCINYSETISTTANREFIVCSTNGIAIERDINSVSTDFSGNQVIQYTPTSGVLIDEFRAGDVVKCGIAKYLSVVSVTAATSPTTDRILTCSIIYGAAPVDTETVKINIIPALYSNYIVQGVDFDFRMTRTYLCDLDYDLVVLENETGFKTYGITFKNNFEARFAGDSAFILNPQTDDVKFYAVGDLRTHSRLSYDLINYCIDTNISKFETATGDYASLMVPDVGESSFPKVKDLLEKLCKSFASYLYLDSDLIGYGMFKTAATPTDINAWNVIEDSVSISEITQDISSKITVDFLWCKFKLPATLTDSVDAYNVLEENEKVLYLELMNVDPPKRSTEIVSINTKKYHLISMKTKLVGYDLHVGSFIKYNNLDYTITAIEKGIEGCEIEAVDVLQVV
jgi:hypothetical protein